MTIQLSDHEAGHPFDGPYAKALAKLQKRLERIQVAHVVHRRRAVVMFEGWDAAGKGGIVERLTAGWDPRNFAVWPIAAPTPAEKAAPFLDRFRHRLPAPGRIAIFDRSWYGRVLVERVERFARRSEWRVAYATINDFEAALAGEGVTLVKLFVHVTQKTQDKRIRARLADPWKRWKTGADDFRNRAKRADYLVAMREMFDRTDTAVAPWTIIDGNDKKAARIAALGHIADALAATVDMTPPAADPAALALAEKAFGTRGKGA